jgi:hypothetical protein
MSNYTTCGRGRELKRELLGMELGIHISRSIIIRLAILLRTGLLSFAFLTGFALFWLCYSPFSAGLAFLMGFGRLPVVLEWLHLRLRGLGSCGHD